MGACLASAYAWQAKKAPHKIVWGFGYISKLFGEPPTVINGRSPFAQFHTWISLQLLDQCLNIQFRRTSSWMIIRPDLVEQNNASKIINSFGESLLPIHNAYSFAENGLSIGSNSFGESRLLPAKFWIYLLQSRVCKLLRMLICSLEQINVKTIWSGGSAICSWKQLRLINCLSDDPP